MKKEQQQAERLSVIYRATDSLIPYARNSRTHSAEQVAQIAASIKEFGFTNPILTDGENGVIAGHGRLEAARKLGLEQVPTIDLANLTDAQKRAYVIADNKIAMNAGWDIEALSIEMEGLSDDGFDLSILGFDMDEIDEILSFGEEDDTKAYDDGLSGDYSQKIEAPIYEPKGEKPAVSELFDTEKTEALISEIEAAELPEEIAGFLKAAAERHTVFNFRNIAEFYAHADSKVQSLMERSALVIIDFNQAIESGYVKLSGSMAGLVSKEK